MNKGFYLKMAWGNIRKNRNIYLPYLLAASVMTALFYIQVLSVYGCIRCEREKKCEFSFGDQYTDNG